MVQQLLLGQYWSYLKRLPATFKWFEKNWLGTMEKNQYHSHEEKLLG